MLAKLKHAINGIWLGLAGDASVRLHVVIACLVFTLGVIVSLPALQWTILLLTVFGVIALEYINSAIETFANHVHPAQHAAIKKTKDLAAGAVLIASLGAVLIGLFIFLPALINFIVV